MNNILLISGQTGTGKTNLAVSLAKEINGEIVTFDSRQVYKYLDIITGKDFDPSIKPTLENINKETFTVYHKDNVPMWLYDIYDPKEYASAHEVLSKGTLVIQNILDRGKVPIVVGGTIFYINTFLHGLDSQTENINWEWRQQKEEQSLESLQNELIEAHKKAYDVMNHSDQMNKRRLIRALEKIGSVIDTERRMYSTHFNILHISLTLQKELLSKKITKRVLERIEQGAMEEVESLLEKGYSFSDPGLNSNGYKQLKDFFLKKTDQQTAIDNWIKGEIDHSRRQLVFLKKIDNVTLFDMNEDKIVEKIQQLVYNWNKK